MVSDMFPLRVAGALTRCHGKVLVGPVDLELEGQIKRESGGLLTRVT